MTGHARQSTARPLRSMKHGENDVVIAAHSFPPWPSNKNLPSLV